MKNFKKGNLVKLNSNMIDSFRKTNDFEEIAYVERNKSDYARLQNLKNYPDKVTLIFTVKGKYDLEKHGLSIGMREEKCRIDVLREKIELIRETIHNY
jgi:hypothetical protein